MFKYTTYIILFAILFISCFTNISTVQASSTINGLFVNFTYEEVILEDKTTEKQLASITLVNSEGKTTTLNIDEYVPLFVNSTPTTVGAFKEGMRIEATVNFRKVHELNGFTSIDQGESDSIGRNLTGTINNIDNNGQYITINLKNRQQAKYYIDVETQISKDNKLVDLSELYEGDRVKLYLSDDDSDRLSSIEIIVDGIKIEQLYKGTIQKLDNKQKKLTIKDEKVYENWQWKLKSASKGNITSKTFTVKTPIYLGNKKVDPIELHKYVNNEVYYVTINQSGEEIIQKIIIKKSNERTYHANLTTIDTSNKKINLANKQNITYHNGTIIIRNGRLVDASALKTGDANIITNGTNSNQYANVIHISNSSFKSSSLSNKSVYFGQINSVGSYQLFVNNTNQLTNNYWYSTSLNNLNFSNDTVVVENGNVLTTDFNYSSGKYAYFYVKDNHIVAARIVGSSYGPASSYTTGRLIGSSYNWLNINNVKYWNASSWQNYAYNSSFNISNTTFIKEGQVISFHELQENDRLFIIHDSNSHAQIILVD
ncbi:hypothetical protein [Psychrobacillus psychrodurans]|uniref:hypothetical protein n=1 Tax=Psychrobacillus psychrodurans TaxID=126157 RepID=UPI0008F00B66|nr:hypothetical protein [Psychrobacillus psychrodurans]MCZ8542267.1 hypothetical protein [Psychrobacillus psychrodurans]SFN20387.1 hypothetical protein SAMN05421832_12035 [Psychrobacillus psychrodurans]